MADATQAGGANVTQADREAATKLQEWAGDDMALAARMLGAAEDDHPQVQAFARHRLSATPAWQPIATVPRGNSPVLLYFSGFDWPEVSALRLASERYATGWYEDGKWFQTATGHPYFEGWESSGDLPTHWMPLPAPPSAETAHG